MLSTVSLLILIALVWGCAYRQMNYWLWAPLIAIVLIGMSYYQLLSITWQVVCWLLFGASASVFGIPWLRQPLLTKPVLAFFRRALPPISQTEKEALAAGDVWWEKDLFSGKPDWKSFLAMKKPRLSDEEYAFVHGQVDTLCHMIDDWTIVQGDGDLPAEVWAYLKQERFFGMTIPKAYGGLGFSALAHSSVVTKIATRSVSTAVNVMVPNSLGPGELLMHYGTPAQKDYYLPRLARGEEIPCFALTSNEAGSDAAAMTDRGVICQGLHQGEEVLGIRLTWDKRYITLAPIATLLGLAFKLSDPDHLFSEQTELGITLCLIPTDHPGVCIGRRHFPLSMAFMNGPTQGTDVFIPMDWIIGGPSMAGHGWRMLMECLAIGRGISLPALSAADGQLAYRMTGVYCRLRKQFKLPIGKFAGIAEAMGRIAGYSYLLNACRILTASAVDQGIKPSVASAITKYHMTELLRKSLNDTMDIHAGRGIQLGPRNYLGHAYQAVPIAITVEGANILTRNLMIFGQGAMRCHPFIRHEMEAAADSNLSRGFKEFDRLLTHHIGFAVSNVARTLWLGISHTKWSRAAPVHGPTAPYYRQLTRMSTALAFVADIAMLVMGGDLKRKECLSARLGDVLSQLYLASSVLKYYQDLHAQPDDLPYVEWILQGCLHDIQQAFEGFFDNFPHTVLAKTLQRLVFPFGRCYPAPKDALTQRLAQHMMEASKLRERLTNLCYLGQGANDPIGRMELAFTLALQAEPLQQKLQAALKNRQLMPMDSQAALHQQARELGLINTADIDLLTQAETARLDALKVDDFAAGAFVRSHLATVNS